MIDIGSTDVLETSRNVQEDRNRICAFFILTMTAIQPGSKGQDDNYEGTTEC